MEPPNLKLFTGKERVFMISVVWKVNEIENVIASKTKFTHLDTAWGKFLSYLMYLIKKSFSRSQMKETNCSIEEVNVTVNHF